MFRIIVRTDNAGMAANVGGAVETTYQTFDIEAPEVEKFLRQPTLENWQYAQRQIVGVELKR